MKAKTYSLDDLAADGLKIENNILKKIDINIIAHFENAVCLELMCDDVTPMST